jgi:hypothetical protein
MLSPHLLLFVGNAVAQESVFDYLSDNVDLLPPILASSVLVAVFLGSISLAISCLTARRAISTVALLGTLVVLTIVGSVLVNTTSGPAQDYSVLISPLDVVHGVVAWLFDATPSADSNIALSGLDGPAYLAASAAYCAVALGVVYRRYQGLAA